ncbi:hypothetical protein, partial [Klebsiella pneumoniae]|uniref:hypothetical protein n=1 Tax=Klebsiella pneumoniae TaxID=573 RepID=UPI003CFD371E
EQVAIISKRCPRAGVPHQLGHSVQSAGAKPSSAEKAIGDASEPRRGNHWKQAFGNRRIPHVLRQHQGRQEIGREAVPQMAVVQGGQTGGMLK